MALPFSPPLAPMLAELESALPSADGWRYEPKWDGFRAIVFRDGDDVYIGSRGQKTLQRYFPEVVAQARATLPRRCVVDGEIVVPIDGVLEFDMLSQRIHPADSRVRMLAERWPATLVAFDLLAEGSRDLRKRPLSDRAAALGKALGEPPARFEELLEPRPRVVLTPHTHDPAEAQRWLLDLEPAGLDGVMAKREDLPYLSNERAMVKVKRQKTADCVVGGYRVHKSGDGVGSLLLALYDGDHLRHVEFTAAFDARTRRKLLDIVRPHEGGDAFAPGAGPGGPSRWRAEETPWTPLQPALVCEVAYDKVTGDRIRHGARFLRWRPDKPPRECTMEQLRTGGRG